MMLKLTIKTCCNALCAAVFFIPAVPYAATIGKVDFKEYSDKVKVLNAVCKEQGRSGFSGFCLTRAYGPVTLENTGQTSITLGLEIASFERFYSTCEHSVVPTSDLLAKAKVVLDAQKYFEEIKPQEEALQNYTGRFYFCASKSENDATLLKRFEWFEYMIQKYSAPGKPRSPSEPPLIRAVWQMRQLSCNGFVALQSSPSPHAEAIRRTGVVQLPQVQLQFSVPRLPDLPEVFVRLVFDDRGRKVTDHYVLLARNDLDAPVAALLVTELPSSIDTVQKALGAAIAGERDNVEGTTARAVMERVATPWGEGLDVFVPNRIGSPCFPTARYKLSPTPEENPTIGLSRFVVMPGRLVQFAFWLAVPPAMSQEEQKAYARKAMDAFAVGLRPL
jgi:hypothetical protein